MRRGRLPFIAALVFVASLASPTFPLAGASAAGAPAGLVAHWRLNEAAGQFADVGPNAISLSPAGALTRRVPGLVSGDTDPGLGFPGSAGYASSTDSRLRPGNVSFAVWLATTDIDPVTFIGGAGDTGHNGYVLYLRGTGGLVARVGKGDGTTFAAATASGVANDGAPHLAVMTHDGTRLRVYLDGVERGSVAAAFPIGYGPITTFRLGNLQSTFATRNMSGTLDEPKLYDRALSASEVMNLFEVGSPEGPARLVGHWRLNEAAGGFANVGPNDISLSPAGALTRLVPGLVAGDDTALGFPGPIGHASSTDPRLRPAHVTFAVWMDSTDPDPVTYVGGAGDTGYSGYVLYFRGTGGVVARVGKGDGATFAAAAASTVVNDGAPHLVVMTHDGARLRIYVDGLERASAAAPFPIGYGSIASFRIGNLNFSHGTRNMSGTLDEPRVYDEALSGSEILAIYEAEKPDEEPPPAAVLVGAGDISKCSTAVDSQTAQLVAAIEGTVFTLGDNVYSDGTAAEFAGCYDPAWGGFKARTRPAPGNHDYHVPGAAGYFGYFGAAAGNPAEGWYAYDLGAWRVYVLNSNCEAIGGCTATSTQANWLRDDLAANPRACTVAMWHHPVFSSGRHGNSNDMAAMWKILYDAGAELVLAGHDHNYERFAPQTPAGALDPARGIRSFIVGTGGGGLRPIETIQPNSEVRNGETPGVLKLTLQVDRYGWEFIPVAGLTFTDQGEGLCH